MDIVEKLLNRYKLTFSDDSFEKFSSILKQEDYQKDEIILEQGKISRYMYVVEKGIIRQFYYKEGRNITEHFSCEGNVATCLESVFLKEPTRLAVEAIEPSVIHLLDYEKFKNLSNQHSDINKLYQAILEYMLIVSQQKADSWRFESSHERYERFLIEYPEVAKRASIAHIASYLLMAPETLSRVRAGVL
ncbi:cAMP-binding domain of CRP or a regulatory subunit of cAMP-dependent protein kinases [Porphyromonadaceae bacterium KH3CP3RA]|jgi:CRP-like cAMP-binding protein|nr:cAMP-binding domain of CRP or a regulatory subunit of cAMP-dependent protein kinases [Porphyromonadaceae bacterium KH3CP3RA]